MTTKEAFKLLLTDKEWWIRIGLNQNTAYSINKRAKEGKHISLEKMEEILIKAGWKKKPESWRT